MKKLFVTLLISASLIGGSLIAVENPYPDWIWITNSWYYTGTENPPPPPPPVPPYIK